MNTQDYDDNEVDEWNADVIATPGQYGGAERSRPRVKPLAEVLQKLEAALESGEPPVEWTPDDTPWGSLAFRPNSVVTFGAPPAKGKTSLVLNLCSRMLARYPDLRVMIASNEMATDTMVERLVAMRSGKAYRAIRRRDPSVFASADHERAMAEFAQVSSRMGFVERPFTIGQVQEAADEFRADIVFVDFLQASAVGQKTNDDQQRVADVMRSLRALADSGPCVITTAAMSRGGIAHAQNRVGKMDENDMDMSVFLHASEIEHGVDSAYLLLAEPGSQVAIRADEDDTPVRMWLHCVKGRDLMKTHVPLLFDGRTQSFTLREVDGAIPSKKAAGKARKQHDAHARKSKPAGSPPIGDGETYWIS